MYTSKVDVAISTLRAELATRIERARAGEEVVVTDRGKPVVRLLPVNGAPLLDQLVSTGVLSRPQRTDRPKAVGEPGSPQPGRWPSRSATNGADEMAIVYFDSSAFVKLLVEEDGSRLAAALWN